MNWSKPERSQDADGVLVWTTYPLNGTYREATFTELEDAEFFVQAASE